MRPSLRASDSQCSRLSYPPRPFSALTARFSDPDMALDRWLFRLDASPADARGQLLGRRARAEADDPLCELAIGTVHGDSVDLLERQRFSPPDRQREWFRPR